FCAASQDGGATGRGTHPYCKKREAEKREAEKREAEKREARSEKREARSEKREARSEKREARLSLDAPPAINRPEALFPVVGIGASAGGLEALTALLKHLPSDSGMAFVLIQHLDPKHPSHLTELLSKATRMPVLEVTADTPPHPNHIYVISPGISLSLSDGCLRADAREPGRNLP